MSALLNSHRFGGSTFDPTSITGCKLWLDADDPAVFTYSSSTFVSQWNDKSGQGNHVVQATGSKQPNRNVSVNGRTAVAFDSTDSLKVTPAAAIGANGFTLFAVFRKTGSNNAFEAIPIVLGQANQGAPLDGYNATRVFGGASGAGYADIRTLTSLCQWTMHVKEYIPAVQFGIINERVDGVDIVNNTSAGQSSATGSQNVCIATRDDGATQLTGDIGEILAYDAYLSSTDRDAIEAYLKAKWGTP